MRADSGPSGDYDLCLCIRVYTCMCIRIRIYVMCICYMCVGVRFIRDFHVMGERSTLI